MFIIWGIFLIFFNSSLAKECQQKRKFPEGFQFGVATASYQIEGAWNISDKGESIWDYMSHKHPESMYNGENGDVACDSYHRYKEDVQMIKFLGAHFYRFSISWPRLLPTGFSNIISEDGKRYYNNLIDELLANNIKPVITLYHWDLPQSLQKLGGWTNPIMADYFKDYARVAFEAFGDRVKTWLTFNEPQTFCTQGYGSFIHAPQTNMPGIADYLCLNTMLIAHAKAYHLYNKKYRRLQNGRIGITIYVIGTVPEDDTPDGLKFDEHVKQFIIGLFANPIYSKEGGYPKEVQERINRISNEQGFGKSRLPELSQEQIEYIRGTYDFFGLNHYTTYILHKNPNAPSKTPNLFDDAGFWNPLIYPSWHPSWPSTKARWLKIVPWGFRSILNWLRKTYDNPEFIVFENGFPDDNGTDDPQRINFHRDYLSSMLDAIDDGVKVTGYTAWSLMDNLEWTSGFNERFGLFNVNFDSPNKTRTPKKSAYFYKSIIEYNAIDSEDIYCYHDPNMS